MMTTFKPLQRIFCYVHLVLESTETCIGAAKIISRRATVTLQCPGTSLMISYRYSVPHTLLWLEWCWAGSSPPKNPPNLLLLCTVLLCVLCTVQEERLRCFPLSRHLGFSSYRTITTRMWQTLFGGVAGTTGTWTVPSTKSIYFASYMTSYFVHQPWAGRWFHHPFFKKMTNRSRQEVFTQPYSADRSWRSSL
jgi:hypothetical protein